MFTIPYISEQDISFRDFHAGHPVNTPSEHINNKKSNKENINIVKCVYIICM